MAEGQSQQEKGPSNVSNLFQTLDMDDQKIVNVLLLGPSKAGKSTFVNALANYLTYKSLDDAEKEKLVVVDSSSFTIIDKNSEEHTVTVKPDGAEDEFENDAVIQTFVLPVNNGKTKLRLICTPGLCGASEGDEDDQLICEDILSYVAQLDTIHAVCCILPVNSTTDSQMNTFFDYCFNKILSGLNRRIYENLLLLFTHSQATYHRAGSSLSAFKKFLSGIENGVANEQLIQTKNTFYLENNSFRYLAARQNDIEFDLDIKKPYKGTWGHSYRESQRFINYVIGGNNEEPLYPYLMHAHISALPIRWSIIKLLQPIFDILDFIKNNLTVLEERLKFLSTGEWSAEAIDKHLKVPGFNLKVTSLPQPVTMCANSNGNRCAICYTVDSIQIWQLQRCCESCHLSSPPRCLVGDSALLDCEKMQAADDGDVASASCSHCGCSAYNHVHAYYLTRMEETAIDCGVAGSLHEKLQHVQKEIEGRIVEYHFEMKSIVESAAEFVHFLQSEAIASYDDPYEVFFHYLISRESVSGKETGSKNIKQMELFLQHYKDMKDTLTTASDLRKRLGNEICLALGQVQPEKVANSIDMLYGLKHTGSKIRELLESQKPARTKEFDQTIIEINLNCNKDVEHQQVSREPRENRQNVKRNQQDGSAGRNWRGGRGGRWRNNRGRRGAYGNHNQGTNRPQAKNDEYSDQPPPYSQIYPHQHAPNRNPNTHQHDGQHSATPYVQINVINDSQSAAAEPQSANMSYTHGTNQQQGFQQYRGGGYPNRGNSYQNRGAGGQYNRGGNRPNWSNNNRQNQKDGDQQGANQNRRQNTNSNQNQFRERNWNNGNNQNQQYGDQQGANQNRRQNMDSNQNQFRERNQQRAGSFDQHIPNVGSAQQNTGSSRQQADFNRNQRANSGQKSIASSQANIQSTSRPTAGAQTYNRSLESASQVARRSNPASNKRPPNKTECIVM